MPNWTKRAWSFLCRHKVTAAIGAIIIAVGGAVFAVQYENRDDKRQEDASKRDPLRVQVEVLLDRNDPPLQLGDAKSTLAAPRGLHFDLVVPDPHELPEVLPPRPNWPGDDCKTLWQIGVEAGGQPPTSGRYNLIFTGKYKGGDVSVTELRARILKRGPPSDGALLQCTIGGMGLEPAQPFACDLTKSDPAVCTVDGLSPLSKIGRMSMREGDHEEAQVSVKLPPGDSVEWFFEAKVNVGDDEPRWIRINADSSVGDSGSPFRSLGLRDSGPDQRYREYIWSVAAPALPIPGLFDAGWRRGIATPPAEAHP